MSRTPQHRQVLPSLWALLAMAALASACSESKDVKGTGGAKQETDDDTTDDDAGTLDTIDENTGIVDINAILGECGVTADMLADKERVLMQRRLKSWPKTFAGVQAAPIVGSVNYRVSVVTLVDIKATPARTEQTTDFQITAVPSQAEGPAREKTAPLKGTSTTTSLSIEERSELMGQDSAWDGIYCTIQPARELASSRGGKSKVVKFTPALPASISPMAVAQRYIKEIGQGKTFQNITAEIVGSSDPAFPQGKTLTGRVTVTRVDPVIVLQVNGGAGSQTITGDAAYRMDWDFGGVDNTVGIGLMPSQVMLISHSQKTIKALVADTGFKEGGVAVLSEEF